MNNLVDILKGCLFSDTVHQAESMLAQYSQRSTFLQQLLVLIPGQQPQVLVMILSTLKNYMLARWNPPPQNNVIPVPQDQKQLIKDNIFNLFYEIKHNDQAVNLYKEIVYMMILVDYPWPGLDEQMVNDLNTNIFASAHFCRQIAKAFEYTSDQNEKKKVQYFVTNYFPRLQNLVEQSLTNFNDQTSKLLYIILKTFYSSFHIDLPEYLKNQDNFVKWFVYAKTILNAQLQNNIFNQRISARILSRMVSQYLNQQLDGKNLKGWSQSLKTRIGQDITQTIFNCLSNPNGDEQTASYILDVVSSYCKNQKLRQYLNEQNFNFILYNRLLPNMETSQSDLQLFQKDPIQYIRKDEDITSNPFKRNAADTVQRLLHFCIFGQKSELMKFIQYTAVSLQSNTVSDRHKEVLIRQLTKMSNQLKRNKFIKSQFEVLTNTYFLPLLKVDSPLLNSEICRFFAAYLDEMTLSEGTVSQLMSLIYEKMIGKYMVLKYNAILAFTSLLSQESALKSAKAHFQNILEIYVKMLDDFDHQNLLKCLQSIVSSFSNEIVTYAPNLINHLLSKFYQTYNTEGNDQQNEQDGNKQAIAALSTITQILQSPLSDNVYYQASEQIVPMIKQIFDELQEYFGQVLSLINVLVYKAKNVFDAETVYVLCRKLLQGKNCQIAVNNLNYDVMGLLNKITEESDTQYEANLISIIKNLIQKLPDNVLHKYPYPVHSQLILALIQNKRLAPNEITSLNTSLVDNVWAQYLESYKAIVYGSGNVTNPQSLKSITGVSLYPWLTQYFDINLVKIVLSQIQSEEEEDDDDYYEQNTMQMLQKYANQDDDEQACDEYYGTEGVNYAFFYDSPFDSSKDRELFIQKLKSLSNDDANALLNMLNNRDRSRLQILFS